ncbi:hypothetical protein QTI33_07460 [Variovorax sp. J22P271]|uniref:hypothetical protein n=1 Tax=Variovorax davisae TaxID=3053515 RepID=UPI0025764E70|nr:hypothetical protein [Variovorax sp. J22P271]MDM0031982.1 hypothetical protein [Variovorax sp. J22P271]
MVLVNTAGVSAVIRRHLAVEHCLLPWPTDRIFGTNDAVKPVSKSWRSWLLRAVCWLTGLALAGALGLPFVVLAAHVVAYLNLPRRNAFIVDALLQSVVKGGAGVEADRSSHGSRASSRR